MGEGALTRIGRSAGDAVFEVGMQIIDRAGFARVRRRLLARAAGRVLDIGAGAGLNLAWLPPAVTEVVLAEPHAPSVERARVRVREHRGAETGGPGPRVHLVQAVGEQLPIASQSVDTAIVTLVLCSVRDPSAALSEIARVVRPGGLLLFAEHVRSPHASTAAWQDRLAPAWARLAGGCRLNRDTIAALRASALEVEQVVDVGVRGVPPLFRPLLVGSARRA